MPKISCVMPTKDRSDIITETIQSVIDQTEQDWELIIVDDHSGENDKTKKVVEDFADDRIKYFKLSDENGLGISAARNFGNQMATSEIIAVMDSDDICYPERFEKTLEAFKDHDVQVVYAEIDIWDPETGETKKRDNQWYAREFSLEELSKINFIPHPTVCYRRKIAQIFPYNSFFRRAEDWDFYLRVGNSGAKFNFINQSLVKYRRHSGSITKSTQLLYGYDQIVRENFLNYSK